MCNPPPPLSPPHPTSLISLFFHDPLLFTEILIVETYSREVVPQQEEKATVLLIGKERTLVVP